MLAIVWRLVNGVAWKEAKEKKGLKGGRLGDDDMWLWIVYELLLE